MCSICLDEYTDDDKIIKLTCNHIYHKGCIKEWFKVNKNCPNCRKNIISHKNTKKLLVASSVDQIEIIDQIKN